MEFEKSKKERLTAMVTIVSSYDEPKVVFWAAGDTPPTGMPNGSIGFEMDASGSKVTTHLFEADSDTWVPFGS